MRELLLVRKLQEENAKKNKPNENIDPKNPETPIKGHNETADSSTDNITEDTTDNTNQTFNSPGVQELENIESHYIDDNSKALLTPDDKINSTHQLDTSDVDKISEQVRSEPASFTSDNNCNQSMSETSFNEKTEDNQNLQFVEMNAPVNSERDGKDLIDPMSEDEKKHNDAESLALRTKRESLKEFFLQKQPYYIHKDTFTDNQLVLDSDDKTSLSSSTKDKSIKEELKGENPSQESFETIKSTIVQDTASAVKPLTPPHPSLDLSPDEKRQKAAAARNMQKKGLKNFIKQGRLKQKTGENADAGAKESLETKNVESDIINSEENSKLNELNGDDKIELDTKSKDEINNSIHLKHSENKTPSADTDSDCSVDLDALIAGGSDLESGEIHLNDDGLDDGDDDFWRIDPAELERHLTPSTSPLRRQSPDPHSIPTINSLVNITRPVSMIVEEDENLSDTPLEVDGQEADDIMNSFSNANGFDMVSKEDEDDEINEIDMSLDTQITPILKPISPSPAPSPYPTLSGEKSGIPAGLSKTAFSAHFGSPLSPTSSRASSVGDPDEYETMSNGSVRSASSAKSGATGMRRPSTITGLRSPSRISSHSGSPSRIAAPGRADSHSSTPTPQRPRSLSVVSDSSTEESTTSSVGATSPSRIASPTRGLHMSMYNNLSQSISGNNRQRRVSNSSADDTLTRSSVSQIASPRVRPLSRAGSNTGTPKSSNISTGSQSRIRSSVPPSNVNSTKSKYGISQLHAPTSTELEKRSSSRASIAKPSSTATPVRSLSRLGNLSEPSKTSLKKPRPQSIAVGNTSTAKMTQSNNIQNTMVNSNMNSGIRSPSSVLRASHHGGRQSTDSLSSHDEYPIFTPPESPTNASETDSLTSLTSSVSYGSSPGRGTSPIPSHNTSIPTRLSKPSTRTSIAVSANKSPASRMIPSKLATPGGQAVSGLKKPRVTKE